MELFIYLLIFIMGTFFGSFFTLAVYRIPLGQDILYTHSYCPNCKNKLKTIDLIPIISYLQIKGKCRYCGEPVRIRYFLLEVMSGLVFLLYAISFKFNIINIEIYKLISFVFGLLYIASLFIIAGIDKEKIKIQNGLLIYGLVLSIGYIIYACTKNNFNNVYTYGIYLFVMLVCLIANNILLRKNKKTNYIIEIVALIMYMLIFSNIYVTITSILIALMIIGLLKIINDISKKEIKQTPVGFYLCISNIIMIIIANFVQYYIL